MWHLYGHEPLWTYMCDFKSPGVGKDFEQRLHLCGFSCWIESIKKKIEQKLVKFWKSTIFSELLKEFSIFSGENTFYKFDTDDMAFMRIFFWHLNNNFGHIRPKSFTHTHTHNNFLKTFHICVLSLSPLLSIRMFYMSLNNNNKSIFPIRFA